MSLIKQVADRFEQQHRESREQLDREWELRELAGENLVLILQDQYWERTKPSLRSLDENRDCLLAKIKRDLK